MPKIDYSKTVIYQIKCKDTSIPYIYVNFTCNTYIKLYLYKKEYKNGKQCELFSKIRKNGGWENWDMIILEKYPCTNKDESKQRLDFWKSKLNNELTKGIDSPKPKIHPKQCVHCNKVFTRVSSLDRHNKESKCSRTSTNIFTPELLNKIKETVHDFLYNDCRMTPDEIDMLNTRLRIQYDNPNTTPNNTIINNTTITNNINNTIINHITIVELGKENLSELLTNTQKLEILNHKCNSLNFMVNYIHFNPDFKQFQNILIKKLRDNHGYMYKEMDKEFISIPKDDLLEQLITIRIEDIYDFLQNTEGIDPNIHTIITTFLEKMNNKDKEVYNFQNTEIERLIYNKSKKINNKLMI